MNTVFKAFHATTDRFGDKPFIHLASDTANRYGVEAGELSYEQARQKVTRLIDNYQAVPLSPGQRVALSLDNRPEAFTHWLALNALGVSVVPINPQWKSGELEYVFDHSEVVLAVGLSDRIELLQAASDVTGNRARVASVSEIEALSVSGTGSEQAVDNSADGTTECALLYTSGTTGKPKGCMLSNNYFLSTGAWYRDVGGFCSMTEGVERLLTPLPMYHMNAMATSTMCMLMTGGCIIPLDRFHPSTFWQSVEETQPTILHYLGVMPVMLMGIESTPQERAHNIRFGFGAGLSGELHTQFEERFGFKLVEAWAMTETGCTVAVIASEAPRNVGTACFGKPGPHIDFRLVDDSGADVGVEVAGELLVRRTGADPRFGFFSGYLKDAEATDAAWAGGYFNTGDLVRKDAEGALHFVDRKKNVIRRSGENIAAVEVEEILLQHPAVGSVAVAAVPDKVRGDEVFAAVVTDVPEADWQETAQDIVRYCLERLAYYKAPGYLGRVTALPLTPTEKVQRAALKELACAMAESGDCVDTREMKTSRTIT